MQITGGVPVDNIPNINLSMNCLLLTSSLNVRLMFNGSMPLFQSGCTSSNLVSHSNTKDCHLGHFNYNRNESIAINMGYTYIDGVVKSPRGEVVTLRLSSGGYQQFSIHIKRGDNPKLTRNVMVHRLVGYLKYGDKIYDYGMCIRHIDGDKLNNSYDNLVIGTHRDNMLDVPIQDRINRSLKSAETTRRFSEEELASIVVDRRSGMSYKDICEKYDVGKSWCSYFFNKKTYITFNRETLKFN